MHIEIPDFHYAILSTGFTGFQLNYHIQWLSILLILSTGQVWDAFLSNQEGRRFGLGAAAQEAAVLNTVSVRPVNHLSEAVEFLNGRSGLPVPKTDLNAIWDACAPDELDFEDVKGQEHAKRGLEVAAAGSHNALTL